MNFLLVCLELSYLMSLVNRFVTFILSTDPSTMSAVPSVAISTGTTTKNNVCTGIHVHRGTCSIEVQGLSMVDSL